MTDRSAAVTDTDLRRMLHERRLRATAARLAVLRVLAHPGTHHHLTAAQVLQQLGTDGADITASTVYRQLHTLTDAGLAHTSRTSDGTATYGIVLTPHQHVACTRCGTVKALPTATLRSAMAEVTKVSRFSFEGDTIVLHGICPDCRDRAATTSTGMLRTGHPHIPAAPLPAEGMRPRIH